MQLRRAGSDRHHSLTPKPSYHPFNRFHTRDQGGASLIFALHLPSLAALSGAHPPETWTSMRSTTPSSVLMMSLRPTLPRYVSGRAQASPLIMRPRADPPVTIAEAQGKGKGGSEDQGSRQAKSRAEETHTVDPDEQAGRQETSEARERRGRLER